MLTPDFATLNPGYARSIGVSAERQEYAMTTKSKVPLFVIALVLFGSFIQTTLQAQQKHQHSFRGAAKPASPNVFEPGALRSGRGVKTTKTPTLKKASSTKGYERKKSRANRSFNRNSLGTEMKVAE